ncbi:hypothetical protein HU200_046915 [Digitaria exilis]|uniref:Polygalacturonase n=1 Tax=Digitaria exilis TaxID=1010633 RepID=A0A835AXV3_9POAL|nr:hypothetical protein HU200_046915 [Digitaria exilis]
MATSSFRGGLAMAVVLLPLLLLLALLAPLQCAAAAATCVGLAPAKRRREVISITEFGGVGDGRTVNTWAFRKAVYRIEHQRRRGGTELRVPAGTWLTGSFNLTSHMTLFLARGAVLKATTDTRRWPLVEPLPSYGRGREMPGARYASFISGNGLRDVVITGDKGVIDGQGECGGTCGGGGLSSTPGQTLSSSCIPLGFTSPTSFSRTHRSGTSILFTASKSTVDIYDHPSSYLYISFQHFQLVNVVVTNMMILAPHGLPNTDGVDPAGIAIGSGASGGVSDVLVEDCSIFNSGYGIHIKTNVGRGGYIKNVTVDNVRMSGVRVAGVRIAGDAGDHPDAHFSQLAVPTVDAVRITNVWGVGVQQPGSLEGIRSSPFHEDMPVQCEALWVRNGAAWRCRDVRGAALGVRPSPCAELATSFAAAGSCSFRWIVLCFCALFALGLCSCVLVVVFEIDVSVDC